MYHVIIPLPSVNASVSCMMDSVYRRASAPFVTHGASKKWNHSRSACQSRPQARILELEIHHWFGK